MKIITNLLWKYKRELNDSSVEQKKTCDEKVKIWLGTSHVVGVLYARFP